MGIKDIWNKVRKGVKSGMLAIQDNSLNDRKITTLIKEFNNSDKKRWMLVGDKYYKVDNDIFSRKITKRVKGAEIEETYKANNKLAHSKYKNMVDEKVAYLLTRDYSLKCDDENYLNNIKEILGKKFQYKITGLGYECSNKGIAWLQAYIDEKGKFNTMIIPSEQCIPIWKDNSHMELDSMIRVYETVAWEYDRRKTITNVEVWTEDGVNYYKLDNNSLIPYMEKNYDNNGPIAHYKKGDEWFAWGKVPFVQFKNNRIELPDIKFVKSLLDAYDLSRSEAANYVEEVKNLIYILKGYGGEDINEFMKNLNENRAILIDDIEDGGVDTLTPQMDITALKEHYEQLKRDLVEDGQSVNKDLDKFGSSPSGVALKFMYSGLDLKCNSLEVEFKMSIESLLYFINIYLSETSKGNYKDIDVEVIFNRDMQINETEVITNCNNSKGTISDKTIIGNHPWVKNIEDEKKALEEQTKANLPFQDKIPLVGDGANEE
ncbi:phage portal protein [Clostridium gasigenes]|uniref:Phage portal protein, SPP1 family n=1 Tax=Clostridium gasigenes TaxID=94869 RepID=A0A1H0M6Z0_9CLOT|nr:phage portal protein [Clostridium gasigenes]SDO76258.1 phage portal protein, SPP1 family [Clostridium gasigenes]